MSANYKNSYKVSEKELVSLSVYNVGFQKCTPGYQWGTGNPGSLPDPLYISGSGSYIVNGNTYTLSAGDAFWSIRIQKSLILPAINPHGNMHGWVLPAVMLRSF